MAEGGVVVVGGGLAGWTAAVAALEAGADVTLVERARRKPGWGNSVISGGAVHAVLQDPRGDPAAMVAAITELTDGHADPAVAAAWAENAARAVAWLEDHGAVMASDPSMSHRAKVFSPVRPTEPGTRFGGYGLPNFLTTMHDGFVAAGGDVLQPARARGLSPRPGGWDVDVSIDGGGRRSIGAAAVVLADGGFQANKALMRRYVGTDQVRLRSTGMETGDGLLMGLAAGGVALNMNGFYGHLLARAALDRDDLWPYPILDLLAEVGIVVDSSGRRFVDESWSGVTTTNAVAWSGDPVGCWIVVDDDAWEHEGRVGVTPPNPYVEEHGGTVVSAGTVAELARGMGVDGATLGAVVAGVIGDGAAQQPGRAGRVKLSQPPFHAIPVVAGVTFTFGGLRVDGHARVLSEAAVPLPGLYAAGGTMGGLHGGPRAGYAGGLLEAAVFGLLAGEHAGAFAA